MDDELFAAFEIELPAAAAVEFGVKNKLAPGQIVPAARNAAEGRPA
jgi:hypothetical protein